MLGALLAVGVIVWAASTGLPWEQLGFARPASWLWTIVGGIALGVVLKLFTKSVVLPVLGAPAQHATYQDLVGNAALLVQLAFVSIVIGGIGEEIFWRGFLFERLGKALGNGTGVTIAIVLVTTVAFAAAHYFDQGLPGAEQALVTGLAFGWLFAATGIIWPVMIAHATYDLVAIALIYAGLEQNAAHLFFR